MIAVGLSMLAIGFFFAWLAVNTCWTPSEGTKGILGVVLVVGALSLASGVVVWCWKVLP